MTGDRTARVLVTGGAGFIGSHLVQALMSAGYDVTVLDDLSVGRRAAVPAGARFVHGDVCDTSAVRTVLIQQSVDVVYHLAARVTVRGSIIDFVGDARVNVMGTLSVLEACRETSVRRMILASSMAVYADVADPVPIGEDHETEPLAPYGMSKLSAERYARLIGAAMAVDVVTLRYFNTFGPGQSFTPYVGVVTIFIKRLLEGRPPVVFGGGQTRDFVDVLDVVDASVRAMTRAPAGAIINVGSGRGVTVDEIAAMLCHRMGAGVKPEYAPPQPGELRNSIADITRARHVLQFEPRHRLEDRLQDIIDWQRRQRPPAAGDASA